MNEPNTTAVKKKNKFAEVWTVTAAYAYTDVKVSKSNNPLEIGKPISSVPEHNAWLPSRRATSSIIT